MGHLFPTILLVSLGLLLVSAGIEDARTREIANWKNAGIALLAPLWWWSNGLAIWPDMAMQFGVACLVFAFFAAAYAIGQMGGGDVKLIGAVALWLPVQPLTGMLMMMALLGGALTMVMVAERWTVLRGGIAALPWRTIGPIALGLGGLVPLFFVARPAFAGLVAGTPMLLPISLIAALAAVSVALIWGARTVRRRGIVPETPYGVAIAISTLIVLREPIFNQFT